MLFLASAIVFFRSEGLCYLVFSVNCRCGTLVSADSTGSVQFWDSNHGTLLQAHTLHKGDVNALAATPNHNRVYSAGSDGQVLLSILVILHGFLFLCFCTTLTHHAIMFALILYHYCLLLIKFYISKKFQF